MDMYANEKKKGIIQFLRDINSMGIFLLIYAKNKVNIPYIISDITSQKTKQNKTKQNNFLETILTLSK